MLHRLLLRQLKRAGLPDENTPPDAETWPRLLERISRSYLEAEQDRYLLERSLAISSAEMKDLYARLVQSSETRIAEERDRLRTVISSLGAGLGVLDGAGRVLSLNPEGERLLGWSGDDLGALSLFSLLAPPDAERDDRLRQVIEGGETYRDEDARFYCHDGTSLQVSYTLNPIVEHGELRGAVLVFFDVTDRKQLDAQLQTNLNETLLLNRVIGAAAAEFEPHAMLSAVCRELCHSFDLPQAAVALFEDSAEYLTVVAEHRHPSRPSAIGEIIPVQGNPVTQYVIEHKRSMVIENAQGDPRQEVLQDLYTRRGTVSLLIVPLAIRGQVVGTLGFDALRGRQFSEEEIALAERVAAAISQALENAQLYQAVQQELIERTRMQEKLQLARDAAMEASRAKSEFLAMMTHEIRTPMNVILGMTELLAETEMHGDQNHYVSTLQKAAVSLLSLINDVLDLSKIEAGQLGTEQISFDLRELIEKTAELMAPGAYAKGLELVYYVDSALQTECVGDPSRLRQVLVNLLGNAIKFTEHGDVVIRAEPVPGDIGGELVQFTVRDTGVGIPEDRLEAIFATFTQVDSSVTRKHGGTGLGLSISRSLVKLLGGDLEVTSRVGVGSIFAFAIPLLARNTRPVEHPDANALKDRRALVLDDSQAVRNIIAHMLRDLGASVSAGDSHPAALAEITSARANGRPYSLVLLDSQLDGGDSFATASALREVGGPELRLVMMLPPNRRREDMDRLRSAGADDYLIKPLRPGDLLSAATSGRAVVPALAPAPVAPDAGDRLRILLVEDAADNRLLIETHLRKAGHQVDSAENGEVGFAKFIAADYNLVLMDVQMPVMDGYTATRMIREWERAERRDPAPIIALTAHALQDDIEKSLAAGCNSHVTKPISKTRLFEVINKYARKSPYLPLTNGASAAVPVAPRSAS